MNVTSRIRPPLPAARIAACAGVLVLALTGCGAESGGNPAGPASGIPTDGVETAVPEPTGSSEPADDGAMTAESELTIEFTPDEDAEPVTYELACSGGEPVGESSLPDPAAACGVLASHGDLIMTEPDGDLMCTQIFGGPETATVTGTVAGVEVDAGFSRTDGCEVDRWDTFEPLLGSAGGAL